MRILLNWTRRIVLGLIVLLLLLVIGGWALLRLSLPGLGKSVSLPSLTGNVTIDEDNQGVPTIQARSLRDLLVAQGWVTARDRLFQMDLMRRRSAGRLSELFGKAALNTDRLHRVWGFEREADRVVEKMPIEMRRRLEAYADGVNAFMAQGPLPFEIRLLAYRPAPWHARDTILVAFGMFEDLNGPGDSPELVMAALKKAFPQPVVDYLTADYGFLDASIQPDPKSLTYPSIPSAQFFDTSRHADGNSRGRLSRPPRDRVVWGSNAWAVSGKLTSSGKPLLAGDPHLSLRVPDIWYRVKLQASGLSVLGCSLPGVPGVVIGTTGRLAWSFTNTSADTVDMVDLPVQSGGYVSDGVVHPFGIRHERIEVRGGSSVSFDVKETQWGPVLEEAEGRARALEWTALDPDALMNIDLLELDRATDIQQALKALSNWAGPVQNAMLASSDGHIAWAMVGKIPDRIGFDGRTPAPRDRNHFWRGYVPFSQMPKEIDPPNGFIVNANQRSVAAGPDALRFGYDYPSPARAYRIRELLQGRTRLLPTDMLAVQADVRSPTHLWYRDQLLAALAKRSPGSPDERWYQAMTDLIQKWDGEISVRSRAYPFLKAFRLQVLENIIEPFVTRLPDDIRDDAEDSLSRDALVKNLLENRPRNLLASRFSDYDDLLRRAALTAARNTAPGPEFLGAKTWGEINKGDIRHPFSLFLPRVLGAWLDMPHVPFPGDGLVPCALHPKHGPSMRMVVDLSDGARSLFNEPGGQSGHPLSPHYKDLFWAWLHAKASPFEPGTRVATETLSP